MTAKNFNLSNPEAGLTTALPVRSGTIGPDVLDISDIFKDHGVFTFDPAFGVTASCESKITYIDGDAGVLLYRGYPVEQLAEKSSLHGGLLPADLRRTAERQAAAGFHDQHHAPHDDQRVAAALLQRLPPQRPSDGDGVGGRGLDVGLLSRLDGHP